MKIIIKAKDMQSQSAAAPKPSKDYTELSDQIRAGVQMTATDIDTAINKAVDAQQKIITKAQNEIERLRKKGTALKIQLGKRGNSNRSKLMGTRMGGLNARERTAAVKKTNAQIAAKKTKGLVRVGKEGDAKFNYAGIRIEPNAPCTGWLIGTGARQFLFQASQVLSKTKELQSDLRRLVVAGDTAKIEYQRNVIAAVTSLRLHVDELKALKKTLPKR